MKKSPTPPLLVLAIVIFVGIAVPVAAQSDWTVVSRGLDSKTLQKTVLVNGTNQIHQIHVIATGLSYTNPATSGLELASQFAH